MIEYVDHMGNDLSVVNAARVSMGKRKDAFDDKDAKLIRYLVKNGHWSPFRHVSLSVRVECPIFIERQWFKHQIGCTANSISGRYVTYEESHWTPATFRKAAPNVKQGSSDETLKNDTHTLAAHIYETACKRSFDAYHSLLSIGVCKEQARAVLPLATFTQFIFTASLQAWWNFYRQRSDAHAQAEIRVYADALDQLIVNYFPVCWNAFKENAQ